MTLHFTTLPNGIVTGMRLTRQATGDTLGQRLARRQSLP